MRSVPASRCSSLSENPISRRTSRKDVQQLVERVTAVSYSSERRPPAPALGLHWISMPANCGCALRCVRKHTIRAAPRCSHNSRVSRACKAGSMRRTRSGRGAGARRRKRRRARVLLERGRLLRLSGDLRAALPLFETTFERALAAGQAAEPPGEAARSARPGRARRRLAPMSFRPTAGLEIVSGRRRPG